MEEPKKNILILTADAGFGHRSAANAVAAAFQEKYTDLCHVEVVNPLEDKRVPFWLRDSQTDYDKIVREMPQLYRAGYEAMDATLPSTLVESALIILLYEVMRDLVVKNQPDVIVTTYPLYQAPLTAVFVIQKCYIPLHTVITDLETVHRLWFHNLADAFMLPTLKVQEQAKSYAIPPEKTHVTGIPINPQFSRMEEPSIIRSRLGWRTDLPTVLAVGSRRVEHLLEALDVLNHYGAPIQLAIVAGKDEKLFKQLQETNWHVPTHCYSYTTNMPEMMQAANIIVCKAGGLIVTESLACGLPMMLIDILPGQEEGNANYVVQGQAGEVITTPVDMLHAIRHWLLDEQKLLKERAKNARSLGRPLAAYEVAELAWNAANRGPVQQSWHLRVKERITELLKLHNIQLPDILPLPNKEDRPE